MLNESSRRPVAFITVCAVVIGTFLLLPIVDGEICKEANHQTNKNCAPYEVIFFLVVRLAQFLKDYEGAFTAASTIAIAIFTWRLWVSTDKLWDESRNTSERQAREMQKSLLMAERSANASRRSATAAEDSVDAMRNTAERQLRAYVHIAKATINFANGRGEPDVTVEVKNFGQTPAYEVRAWIHMWITEYSPQVELPLPGPDFIMANSILAPSADVLMFVVKRPPVPPENVHLVGTTAGTVYVYGRVEYRDAFGHDRWTNYRLIYGGPHQEGGLMQTDTEGNSAN